LAALQDILSQLAGSATGIPTWVVAGVGLLLALLLVLAVVANVRLWLLQRRVRALFGTRGPLPDQGPGLEGIILGHTRQLDELQKGLEGLSTEMRQMATRLRSAVQGVGLVRFNAFSDTGSDLSFAIAMVDAEGNGIVLLSLYGRDEARVYAKPLDKQASPYPLSDEESQALKMAIKSLPRRATGQSRR